MKKILTLLALFITVITSAQVQTITSQLKLTNVQDGPTEEYVLVRGADGIIKKVLKSSIGGGATPALQAVATVGHTTTTPLVSTNANGVTAIETVSNDAISVRGDGIYFIPDGAEYVAKLVKGNTLASLITVELPDEDGKLARVQDVTLQKAITGGSTATSLAHFNGGLDATWTYGSARFATDFETSNMKQLYFNTTGNGVEYPVASTANLTINPDDHIVMGVTGSGGQTGSFALNPAVSNWSISNGSSTASILLNPTKIIVDQPLENTATNEEVFVDFINTDTAVTPAHFKISNTADDRQQLTLDQNEYHARLKDDGVGFEYDGDSRNSWLGYGGLEMYSADAYDITLDQNNGFAILQDTGKTAGMNAEEVTFSDGSGRFSKIGTSSLGLSVTSPLSTFEVGDYLGGSGWLRFITNGDGTEFPSGMNVNLDGNIETGWNITHGDGGSGSGSFLLNYSNASLTVGDASSTSSISIEPAAGVSITTEGNPTFSLKSNPDVGSNKTVYGPMADGSMLTTGGTAGVPMYGDVEFTGDNTTYKLFKHNVGEDIDMSFRLEDNLISMAASSIASPSTASILRMTTTAAELTASNFNFYYNGGIPFLTADGTLAMYTPQLLIKEYGGELEKITTFNDGGDGYETDYVNDAGEQTIALVGSTGRVLAKSLYLSDPVALGEGNITFDDNTLVVSDTSNNPIFGASQGGINILKTPSIIATVEVSDLTASRQIKLIDAQGSVPIVRTSAPSSSTAAGVKGEIYVDASYIYYCYATNSWRRVAGSTF